MDGVDISKLLESSCSKDDSNNKDRPLINTIKSSIILFLVFLFVMSDVFIYNVISKINENYVDGRNVTLKGIYIQGIFLIFIFIILQYFIEHNFI